MSLRSMTGFGRGSAAAAGLRADAELSSVNRKHLDTRISLPPGLMVLEGRVMEEITAHVSRGCVTGSISVTWTGRGCRAAARVDEGIAAAYIAALRGASRRLGLRDDLSSRDLLDLPGAVTFAFGDRHVERAWSLIRRALREAVARLAAMREREGRALEADLRRRFESIAACLRQIERLAPGACAKYQAALKARIEKAGVEFDASSPEFARELAIFAERCDISEEVVRLRSHLAQAQALFAGKESPGRAMGFLVQEMQREINTIGAKANHEDISRLVVALKTELEKVREQIQNVE